MFWTKAGAQIVVSAEALEVLDTGLLGKPVFAIWDGPKGDMEIVAEVACEDVAAYLFREISLD